MFGNRSYLGFATGAVLLVQFIYLLFFPGKIDIKINYDNQILSLSTSAKTVEGALKEADITLSDRDQVDLPLKTPLEKDAVINIKSAKPVFLVVDGNVIKTFTCKENIKELLKDLSIEIHPEDTIKPSPDTALKKEDYNYILIKRAREVTIKIGNKDSETLRTTRKFVYQVLQDAGIALNSEDRVCPSPNCPVVKGTKIEITRVEHEFFDENEVIPYKIYYEEDTSLPEGQTEVVQEGKNGLAKNIIRTYYKNGLVTSEGVVDREVLYEPVDEIILIGTDSHPAANYVLTMEATAYYPGADCCAPSDDGITATGLVAGYGIIAVDPDVIPLGTRVYVDGYGYAVAGDVGGDINGNRIDLCYDTLQEAINYGRKTTKVYILD